MSKPTCADDISPTFCVMPWVGIATHPTGGYRPCCWINNVPEDKFFGTVEEFKNSVYLKKMKREMLEGKYPKICNKCQREEEAGVKTSRRVRHNEVFSHLIPDILEVDHGMQFVDIRLTNVCNLGCVMCNPNASSFLKKEALAHPENTTTENLDIAAMSGDKIVFNGYDEADIEDLIEMVTPTSQLYFAGGEPGMTKSVFMFLERMIERGINKDVKLLINSNFQIANPRWFELLSNFKGVIMPSLDGVGIRAEFVRYPCNWASVEASIRDFKQKCPDFIIRIAPAVSVLNLFGLPDLFKFVRDNDLDFLLVNKLWYPKYFDICNLPPETKIEAEAMIDGLMRLNSTQSSERLNLEDIKSYMNRTPTASMSETFKALDGFSKIRGLDWRPALPELFAVQQRME
jgi:MoaA/NifB/PqqE/SkfB family radical SAM enzyme